MNSTIKALQAGAGNDLLNYNIASINNGQSKGNALAVTAASGIRSGSSLSDVIEMEAALNSQQLQQAEKQSYMNYDMTLDSLINGIQRQQFGIEQERLNNEFNYQQAALTRLEAGRLYNSYEAGGSQYNLYQQKLSNMENDKNRKKDELQYQYDRYMSEENKFKRAMFGGFKLADSMTNFGLSFNNL